MNTKTTQPEAVDLDPFFRLCEQTWNECYPDRRPWHKIGPDAQAEWIRVFRKFDFNRLSERRTIPPNFQNTFMDGKWYDRRSGSCKLCGGEIPYGHLAHCDRLATEKKITQLKQTLSRVAVRIHGMSYDWNADPDGMTREVGEALDDSPNAGAQVTAQPKDPQP